jgi:signal transduction histidine kinase
MAWVLPQRLTGRWQPEMFRAEFLELDQQIEGWKRVVRLGDLVSFVHETSDVHEVTWNANPLNGISRHFPDPQSSGDDFESVKTVLPSQAILVANAWTGNQRILFWDEELYSGKGVADSSLFVLKSRGHDSIAWIYRALASEASRLQLERAAVGTTFRSIAAQDLLGVKLELPPEAERITIGRGVLDAERQSAMTLRARKLSKSVVLLGRTYEERLDEFEELLVREFGLSPKDVFFVEPATRSRDSDLFTVRSVAPKRSDLPDCLVSQEMTLANDEWRQWFWNSDRRISHRVFNSFVSDYVLPPHIHLNLLPSIPETVATLVKPRILPGFPTYRDAIIESLLADVGVEDSVWASVWCDIQAEFQSATTTGSNDRGLHRVDPGVEFQIERELFDWSRAAYRPVLGVRIWHDAEPAGVYLLYGDDQVYDRHDAFSRLDDLGVELSEVLQPAPEVTEELLRRESLRRLNDIMHRLNGPLLNAQDVLGDVQQFMCEQPAIAEMLIPNEEQARAMAAMNRDSSVVRYQLASRIETLAAAIDQIRGLSSQVKTLSRIEERLVVSDFSLKELVSELENYNPTIRPLVSYSTDLSPDSLIRGDRDLINVAFERVLDNSIREFRERNTDSPRITVTFSLHDNFITVNVEDNALPVDEDLPARAFDERVSKYFRSNKGSGFGLMSVRRIFERHKCKVSLVENRESTGERRPGVTFRASLPCPMCEESDDAR